MTISKNGIISIEGVKIVDRVEAAKEDAITTLTVAKGGTNSNTALNNNRVMVSASGKIAEATAITASRAVVSDSNGLPVHATTTATEIGYVNGVTSGIQTQLNAKLTATTEQFNAKLTAVSATTLAAISEADATTLTTAIALANANKAKVNDIIAKLKTAGVIAS